MQFTNGGRFAIISPVRQVGFFAVKENSMKKAMKTALCGAGLVFLLAGVPVRAAVDGETYRVAGGEEWVWPSLPGQRLHAYFPIRLCLPKLLCA